MKKKLFSITFYSIVLSLVFAFVGCQNAKPEQSGDQNETNKKAENNKKLRHVVLFKFKEGTTEANITQVEEAFKALPSKIPEIKDFEFGINNSPESLDKGFTHCFFLTFDSEEGRAVYLPHPDHKAFGSLLGPYLEDVLVLDYWIEE